MLTTDGSHSGSMVLLVLTAIAVTGLPEYRFVAVNYKSMSLVVPVPRLPLGFKDSSSGFIQGWRLSGL